MSAVTGIIIVYDACDCRCICMYSACECECEFQGVATRFIAIPSRRFPQELMTSDLVIYSPSSSHARIGFGKKWTESGLVRRGVTRGGLGTP